MSFFTSRKDHQDPKRIYVDTAALTPTDPRVLEKMVVYYSEHYGNPSSIHTEGVMAKNVLTEARKTCADVLHALPHEIIFTASGTESNNTALFGVLNHRLEMGKKDGLRLADMHMLISAIEHPSIMEAALHLQKQGMQLDIVSVDQHGIVDCHELKEKLRPETCFVSIMMVNNEIGTVQPIKEIAKIIRHFMKTMDKSREDSHEGLPAGSNLPPRIIFHTDASQAPLYVDINTQELGVDMLTLDSHKVYGPKGVGMLYKKKNVELAPLIFGGGQEQGIRSGTENIPGIAGFSYALRLAEEERQKEYDRLAKLRQYFITSLLAHTPGITVNGHDTLHVPSIINVSIPSIQNEFFVLQLDAKGIACSTKSSCLRDEDESYVIKALNKANNTHNIHDTHKTLADNIQTSVRFSFGRFTTKADVDRIIEVVVSLRQVH